MCRASDYSKGNGAIADSVNGNSWWWLRSPGNYRSSASVYSNGNVLLSGSNVDNNDVVVRPAFWLNLSATPIATPIPTNTPKPTATSVKKGNKITFGHYEQDNKGYNGPEPIEWQVLTVEDCRALLISKDGLDVKLYNEKSESITWKKSSLRQWLNEDFYNKAFDSTEKSRILQVTLENPGNPKYGTEGGSDTVDRIFLLSIDEANRYFASDNDRKCRASDYAKGKGAYVYSESGNSEWWLRSPGEDSYSAAYVGFSGYIFTEGQGNFSHDDVLVRPAFWLEL